MLTRRWFEDQADGGWDIQKLQERMGEADCHIVTEDNVMELTMVDILGRSTGSTGGKHEASAGGAGTGDERAKDG